MFELFKTAVYTSAAGGAAVLVLLIAGSFLAKHVSARLHYNIWLAALRFMRVPLWKFFPSEAVTPRPQERAVREQTVTVPDVTAAPRAELTDAVPMEYREAKLLGGGSVRIYDLAAYIWAAGAAVFIAAASVSYIVFTVRGRRESTELESFGPLEEIKREMGIKRRIRIRISDRAVSPMLSGVVFPVIYIPRELPERARLKMVLRHELTHYKSGDLLFKWAALFVNALHWFNPFAYLLSANIAHTCEVACDMTVVRGMSGEEKRLYMETILDLAEK